MRLAKIRVVKIRRSSLSRVSGGGLGRGQPIKRLVKPPGPATRAEPGASASYAATTKSAIASSALTKAAALASGPMPTPSTRMKVTSVMPKKPNTVRR